MGILLDFVKDFTKETFLCIKRFKNGAKSNHEHNNPKVQSCLKT